MSNDLIKALTEPCLIDKISNEDKDKLINNKKEQHGYCIKCKHLKLDKFGKDYTCDVKPGIIPKDLVNNMTCSFGVSPQNYFSPRKVK